MNATISPVLPHQRMGLIDSLRGFALLGILMVNMQFFAQPMVSLMLGFQPTGVLYETASVFFVKFLFEGKFFVLFSALFGYGFAIILSKSTPEGTTMLPYIRSRFAILLLVGILHLVVLWPGDILIYYAIFGFILILFRKVSDKGLQKWALGLVLVPIIFTSLIFVMGWLAMGVPEVAESIKANLEAASARTRNFVEQATEIYLTGSFQEMANMRLQEYLMLAPGVLFFYPIVLAMFLMGFLAGRKRILENFMDHIPLFRKCLWLGLGIGLPFSLMYAYTYLKIDPMGIDAFMILNTSGHAIGGIFLGLFYVSAIILLVAKNKIHWFVKALAPVGQMALSNYLLQSIIATFIFYGYGLGLMGQISALQGITLSLVIFFLQVPISHVWLQYFQYGPFEWIWRSLTYRKLQPFRRSL